jgi:hypothetical protein
MVKILVRSIPIESLLENALVSYQHYCIQHGSYQDLWGLWNHIEGFWLLTVNECVHGCNFAGVILWYALLRDGVEIFRDPLATSYTDNNAIIPYHTYSYSLEACNSAGCTKSSQVLFWCYWWYSSFVVKFANADEVMVTMIAASVLNVTNIKTIKSNNIFRVPTPPATRCQSRLIRGPWSLWYLLPSPRPIPFIFTQPAGTRPYG